MGVVIVTDSACEIPPNVAERMGIAVVPLNVHFGTRAFEDNVTITPDEFYSMLADSPELPTTSLVSPGKLKETYDRLGADADGIVSIHLSSKLSTMSNLRCSTAIIRAVPTAELRLEDTNPRFPIPHRFIQMTGGGVT